MDVHAIRHRNLQRLVSELKQAGQRQKDAAIALNLGESYLSQLLGGKLMGSDVARKVEIARGLPHGWMDHQHDVREGDALPYEVESHIAGLDTGILRDAIKLLAMVLPITGDPPELLNDEWCIDQAYRIVARAHQARQQTEGNNLIAFGADLAAVLRDRKAKTDGIVERGTEKSRPSDGSNHQRRARGKN